jgi:hypothetical protein
MVFLEQRYNNLFVLLFSKIAKYIYEGQSLNQPVDISHCCPDARMQLVHLYEECPCDDLGQAPLLNDTLLRLFLAK